ncbi:Pentatricopeptide repeat-containing protein [Drosera capensis]
MLSLSTCYTHFDYMVTFPRTFRFAYVDKFYLGSSQSVLQGCNCGPNRSPRRIHSSHPSAMSMASSSSLLINRFSDQLRVLRVITPPRSWFTSMSHAHAEGQSVNQTTGHGTREEAKDEQPRAVGDRITRKEKMKFLFKTSPKVPLSEKFLFVFPPLTHFSNKRTGLQLLDLDNSKESVYGTLDAWVAWEQNFPIASLKNVLLFLEREQQWHRIIQVIKWMLSKGQGNTIRTYQQLIKALDMDHRAEEAHKVWVKKIGNDLHSVPWQFCHLMISVYYRNNMLENLVKLFKNLEAFDRRPPDKLIVQKVANAYELLGLMEDKERVLEKYSEPRNTTKKKSKKCKLIQDKQPDDMSQIAS